MLVEPGAELLDISMPLTALGPFWPGSPGFERSASLHPDKGDDVVNSVVTMDLHIGTHLDAPAHHDPAAATVDQLPLEQLVGPAEVVDIDAGVDVITDAVLDRALGDRSPPRLLLRTRNSAAPPAADGAFDPGFVALDPTGAAWVADRGLALVGIDYLSIQSFGCSNETHRLLFAAEVVVLEGLDLRRCTAGAYTLICLPLSIPGAEAAPARAVLVKEPHHAG